MFVDTSFIVELLREQNAGRRGPAVRTLESIRDLKLQMPVFVLCELRAGAAQSKNPGHESRRLERLAEYIQTVYPAEGFASAYAEVATHLRRQGTPIPLMDLLSAVLAKCHGAAILTRDVEHFSRVPGVEIRSF